MNTPLKSDDDHLLFNSDYFRPQKYCWFWLPLLPPKIEVNTNIEERTQNGNKRKKMYFIFILRDIATGMMEAEKNQQFRSIIMTHFQNRKIFSDGAKPIDSRGGSAGHICDTMSQVGCRE